MRAPKLPVASHLLRRAAAIAGLVTASALASAPAAAGVFNPQLFTLDNGLRVVLIENQATLAVGHVIYYGVGAADETTGQSGLAHLFEHLQLKGTPSHPDQELSRLVARVGGEENASTHWDFTSYYQITAAEHLPELMAMEADRMTNTLLTPEIIDAERLVVYEEFATRIGNNPSAWLGVEARAALFSNHPYGRPVIGYMDELAAVDYDDIMAFHRRWYTPGNAVVVVTGPITLDRLTELAEETYGRIPAGEAPERVRPAEPAHYAPRTLTLQHPQIGQATWSRTYLAPSHRAGATEHELALQVLATIIGTGSSSRLHRRLVLEQGIAVGAGASYNGIAFDLGDFTLVAAPPPTEDDHAAIAAIEAAMDAEIAQLLADGVTQAEVDRAIRQQQATAVFARDSLMGGANIVGLSLVLGYSIEEIEGWPEAIGAVTVDQVNAAARAVFLPNNAVTAIALPGPAL